MGDGRWEEAVEKVTRLRLKKIRWSLGGNNLSRSRSEVEVTSVEKVTRVRLKKMVVG